MFVGRMNKGMGEGGMERKEAGPFTSERHVQGSINLIFLPLSPFLPSFNTYRGRHFSAAFHARLGLLPPTGHPSRECHHLGKQREGEREGRHEDTRFDYIHVFFKLDFNVVHFVGS